MAANITKRNQTFLPDGRKRHHDEVVFVRKAKPEYVQASRLNYQFPGIEKM